MEPAASTLGFAPSAAADVYKAVVDLVAEASRDDSGRPIDLAQYLTNPGAYDPRSEIAQTVQRQTVSREAVLDAIRPGTRRAVGDPVSLLRSGQTPPRAPCGHRLIEKMRDALMGDDETDNALGLRDLWLHIWPQARTGFPELDRGHAVTAIDISPGALEVCRRQGMGSAVRGTVDEHAATGERYDSFLLLGANHGLLESRERAPEFLRALAAMAAPGAIIVGQGRNPTDSDDALHLPYNERNLRAGRIAGQRTMRVRYRDVATPWFHYLSLAPRELAELANGTGWELADITYLENSTDVYLATLQQRK
ncbi:hypothetical protein [Nonomuraea sp. NPDC003201]